MYTAILSRLLLLSITLIILPQTINTKAMHCLTSTATFNTAYLDEYLVQINPGNTSLELRLQIPKTFTQDPWLNLVVKLKDMQTKKSRRLLQYDINICQLLGKGRGKWLTAWIDNFWKYGDMPKTCPMQEGNYSWHNLTLDTSSIPSFVMPAAHYEVMIKIYFKKRSKIDYMSNTTLLIEYK